MSSNPMADQIAAQTSMGAVHLTVSDLDRSLDYYRTTIGLGLLGRENGAASLGTGDDELLVLVEEPGALPAEGFTGLFHFALLVPDRWSLARWLAHSVRDGVQLTGLSDHSVSEAIYLRDPDHHGIEIYADRPPELWEGKIDRMMGTAPLDVESLLGELADPATESFDGLPRGTTMGHVHLCVEGIPETIEFYRDVLGFDLIVALGDQAAFLSAGGYHHHVGGNTWQSRGASSAPPGYAALRHATIVLPGAEERDKVTERVSAAGRVPEEHPQGWLVRDPSENALVLTAP